MATIAAEFEISIRELADRLSEGGLVGVATDTTYAIVAALASRLGVQSLRNLRAVPPSKPLSLLLKDLASISEYAYLDRSSYRLMKRLTPGRYTFILRATKAVPRLMLTTQRTVGVRLPGVPIVDALCEAIGQPLVSASAALGPGNYASTAEEMLEAYPTVDVVLDAGARPPKISTVIDLTGVSPKILRAGAGSVEAIDR